jgi:hypothetical protein
MCCGAEGGGAAIEVSRLKAVTISEGPFEDLAVTLL